MYDSNTSSLELSIRQQHYEEEEDEEGGGKETDKEEDTGNFCLSGDVV